MDPSSLQQWYHTPLSGSDILAGGLLVLLPVLCILLYVLVIIVLWNASKEIIGFRYLLSSAVADIQCMIQYGLLDGIAILTKNNLVSSKEGRGWMHFWIVWVWFAYCFHLPLIAWSRLHAIFSPLSFRYQKSWISYAICGVFAWLLSLVICFSTVWQPFFVHLYYEPAIYGFLAEDFTKYLRGGTSQMFLGIHVFVVVLPFLFYSLTIVLLIRHRRFVGSVQPEHRDGSKRQSIETKLIVPCIIGTIIFAIGQVAITIGTGSGPCASWTICFLFFLDAASKPVLLLACSPFVRSRVISLLLKQTRKAALSSVILSR